MCINFKSGIFDFIKYKILLMLLVHTLLYNKQLTMAIQEVVLYYLIKNLEFRES